MQRFHTYLLVKRHRFKRSNKKNEQKKSIQNGAYFLVTIFLITILALPVVAGVLYTRISKDLPSVKWLPLYLDRENGTFLNPTTILDSSEQTVLYELGNYGINRRFLPFDPNQEEFISPYLVQFTIAAVEPDFWTSPGYQSNWFQNEQAQTMAEHLVTRLLLWEEDSTWITSLRMRLLAAQITNQFGRGQILEWTLNSTAYGHHTIGVDQAARLYLNKPASAVNMAEAALLVATSQKPAINPLDAPQAALENQQEFLETMLSDGVISQNQYEDALATEILLNTPPPPYPQPAKAFTQLVLNRLYRDYGMERIELGGLRVITTLDVEKQTALTCTTRIQLNRSKGYPADLSDCAPASLLSTIPGSQNNLPADLQASAIILDPATGSVLAYLGDDTGRQESGYTQRHQAASLLTPLVTVNAFARGFSPATQLWDVPNSLPLDLETYQKPAETYQGPIRLRTAIIQDLLAPLSLLNEQLGADLIWRTASSFGLGNLTPEDANRIFFTEDSANLIEIGQFYNTFVTYGTRHGIRNPETGVIEAVFFSRVETTDGFILFEHQNPDSASIVSPQLAYLMHDILQDEYERRSAYGYPNLLEIGRPTGAKYGSNFSQNEVWTVGYTPNYTTVVWFGLPEEENEVPLTPKTAGAVWHALMQWLHKDLPTASWEQPAGISETTVCTNSGLLPTRECPNTISEKFLDGSQPVSYDTLYRSYAINRETGLLATVFTPPEQVEERTFMILPENALTWAAAADIPQAPKNYDSIQAVTPSETVKILAPEPYQYLSGNVQIRGTADGADLQNFQLQIGAGLYPETWLQIGEEQDQPKNSAILANWDTTAHQDGLYALRLQVVRQNLSIENHTIQVSIDNTPPLVTPIYPVAGSEISAVLQGQITLQADIQDQIGIQEVVWLLDGQEIGKQTQMPYSYPVSISSGKHKLVIEVTDLAGNTIQTDEIPFTVK